MSTWHYEQNGQPCGPVTAAALQELFRVRGSSPPILPPTALVWKDGMANWAPANTVPEFSAVINAPPDTPPPLPHSFGAPPVMGAPPSFGASASFGVPPSGGSGAPPTIGPTVPPAPAPTQTDIEQNKVYAVLAYIGILFLVPLLAAPNSRFARYHTNQGIVLFITSLIAYPASWFLGIPFAFLTFGFGLALPVLLAIGLFALLIIGIVNAASGQCKPLPLIGHFELMK
jgi:uncharacterized membrane protein